MWPLRAQNLCNETPEMSTRVAQPLIGDSWCACGMAEQSGRMNCVMCLWEESGAVFFDGQHARPRRRTSFHFAASVRRLTSYRATIRGSNRELSFEYGSVLSRVKLATSKT